MNPIKQLLGLKLAQCDLRAQLERSKAITRPAVKTPLFDAVAAASKATGKSGDELVAEYMAGDGHPLILAALVKPSEAQLDKMQRDSLAAKKQREQVLAATEKKAREYGLRKAVKPAGRPSASAAPAPAETERQRLQREMQAIENPSERRAFRLRNWNKLAGNIQAPEPRKSTK